MARYITINHGKFTARIAPDNGGMVTSFTVDGVETLRLDETLIDVNPMLSGGIPLLFPFPSRTLGDEWQVHGKTYGMPFHGLVKNCAFGVKSVSDDSVTLYITNCEAWQDCQYPFDFLFTVTYSLSDFGLAIRCEIKNRGKLPLPHAIGLHPFFKSTDKKAFLLKHTYAVNYDYNAHIDAGEAPKDMEMSETWDHVFHTPSSEVFEIENPADGYRVRVKVPDSMPALVVCTTQDCAVCVEPWCGIPNSANSGRFVRTVAPGESDVIETVFLAEKN